MFFYFGKTYVASQAGARVVGVVCDKCNCTYYYELTRIGSGAKTASYGLGKRRASRKAQEQSEIDLQERLDMEAELVPCPKCHWINEELVRGYRLGRYRGIGTSALSIGLGGSILSFVSAWYISIGQAQDRWLLPYLVIGGPCLFVSLAIALLIFRKWLRNRIRPNRFFPDESPLPPGTPLALLLDEATQDLRPAANPSKTFDEIFDFQFGLHKLPDLCSECMKPSSKDYGYPIRASDNLQIQIPRCTDCALRTRRQFQLVMSISAVIGLIVGVVIGNEMGFMIATLEWWIIILCLPALVTAVAFKIAEARWVRNGYFQVVSTDLSRGVVRLQFRNRKFTRALVELNRLATTSLAQKP